MVPIKKGLLLPSAGLDFYIPRPSARNYATLFTTPVASTLEKRQRVSLACDSYRTAREKCDGNRPH